MYAFVEKHFLHRGGAASAELAFVRESQHDLECGLPGGNKTTADIYAGWLRRPTPLPQFPSERADAERIQNQLRQHLRDVLGLSAEALQPRAQVQATASRGDVLMRRLIVEPEHGIRLPVVEIQPRNPGAGIIIMPGKTAAPVEAVAPILEAGLTVALVDPRNTGEAAPGTKRTDNWS